MRWVVRVVGTGRRVDAWGLWRCVDTNLEIRKAARSGFDDLSAPGLTPPRQEWFASKPSRGRVYDVCMHHTETESVSLSF